jgi:hypothetical protein
VNTFDREESKPDDSDLDEPWIMTVKGIHLNANHKPSLFTLEHNSFKNSEPNSGGGSPDRHDVNLNHLNIVNPSHSQSHSFSPTREVPETQISKKSMIDSSVEMNKNDGFDLKTPEKDLKDVSAEWQQRHVTTPLSCFYCFQVHENDKREESLNGGSTIHIPNSDLSPKSPTHPMLEKRNSSSRQEQHQQQQTDERGSSGGGPKGAKTSNHFNNNKVNSACLNNLILPLLSEVSHISNSFFLAFSMCALFSLCFSTL